MIMPLGINVRNLDREMFGYIPEMQLYHVYVAIKPKSNKNHVEVGQEHNYAVDFVYI